MLDLFSDYSKRLQLEKMVIGLEEPIFIKDIGEFIAKIDSGNGGFNVIHGEDVYQNGGVIVFKTFTKDNELKQVSKKLLQYINVNIGSGKVEQRPVIELNVKFGDEEYQKVPFSIANRSSNKNKVLICKDFIQHQLNALIDVSGNMLSNQGVEVEYITEDSLAHLGAAAGGASPQETLQGMKNIASGLANSVKKAGAATGKAGWKVLKGAGNLAKKGGKVAGKFVFGQPAEEIKGNVQDAGGLGKILATGLQATGKFTDAALDGAKSAADDAADYDDIPENDKKLIAKKAGASLNDLLIFKLVDYQGKYYNGGNAPVKAEEENYKAFTTGNKVTADIDKRQNPPVTQPATSSPAVPTPHRQTDASSTGGKTQQNSSYEYKLAKMILETKGDTATITSSRQDTPKPAPDANKNPAPTQQPIADDTVLVEYKRISDIYEKKRQHFFIYFVARKKNIKSLSNRFDKEIQASNKTGQFIQKVNNLFNKIKDSQLEFNEKSGNALINRYFINDLNYLLDGKNTKTTANYFAICWGDVEHRRCYLSEQAKPVEQPPAEEDKPKQDEREEAAPADTAETDTPDKEKWPWEKNEILKLIPNLNNPKDWGEKELTELYNWLQEKLSDEEQEELVESLDGVNHAVLPMTNSNTNKIENVIQDILHDNKTAILKQAIEIIKDLLEQRKAKGKERDEASDPEANNIEAK